MANNLIVGVMLLFAIPFSLYSAQNKTEKAKPVKKTILIVKDSSDLEATVSRIINDSLAKKGYKIKETNLADVGKENPSSYKLSIIFSAVNAGEEIDPRIQKYISSKIDPASKTVIFTVYGAVYSNEKDKTVDASSEATKTLRAPLIAEHILQSLKL
jgi:hypothetical protein